VVNSPNDRKSLAGERNSGNKNSGNNNSSIFTGNHPQGRAANRGDSIERIVTQSI
jgi:hypothetical protein